VAARSLILSSLMGSDPEESFGLPHSERTDLTPQDGLNLVYLHNVCGHEDRGLPLTVNNEAIREGYLILHIRSAILVWWALQRPVGAA
jgi:hypothetical protein